MCVHISWQVKNNWREAQIEHGEPKEPYTCTSRGAPAYFVSYLYNYFKVSTDFGFPFREKTIKPCSPGLSGVQYGSYRYTFHPPSHHLSLPEGVRLSLVLKIWNLYLVLLFTMFRFLRLSHNLLLLIPFLLSKKAPLKSVKTSLQRGVRLRTEPKMPFAWRLLLKENYESKLVSSWIQTGAAHNI